MEIESKKPAGSQVMITKLEPFPSNSQLYLIGDVGNNTLAPVPLASMTPLALVV